MNMMGMKLTMVAESVDQGKVDDKVFRHPVGLTAEANSQSDEMARNMARQAIAMLKDPDNAKNTPMLPQGAIPSGGIEMSQEEREALRQVQEMMKGMKGKSAQ